MGLVDCDVGGLEAAATHRDLRYACVEAAGFSCIRSWGPFAAVTSLLTPWRGGRRIWRG